MIAKVKPRTTRLCLVCNRVKPNTLSFKALMRFLDAMRIPVIAQLRETQSYIKASEHGLGIHEMSSADERDLDDWRKIIDWLDADQPSNKLKVVIDNA